MKFEDLKLPEWENSNYQVVATNAARAIYDQMHAHYEAKLAEAKPEPEELFEHHDMPGKRFRRLKVGEMRERTDFACSMNPNSTWVPCATYGHVVGEDEACHYYREVSQPAPAWRLPDPPPGQQWHRTDWTQEMLPEGYRPLLLGEPQQDGDEFLRSSNQAWTPVAFGSNQQSRPVHHHRRPLPTTSAQLAPVEYVQLGPQDVPPGSAVRRVGATSWRLALSADEHTLWVANEGFPWAYLAKHCEILRPGSKTWEPCKKIKP
jgi:hypothetical protein